ncbi:reverse transcriptase domain-containing protein [Klebsiella pneumoniae]
MILQYYEIYRHMKTNILFFFLPFHTTNVEWNTMFSILKDAGINFKDRRVFYNLYRNQTAVVRMNEEEVEAKIGKGTRQGGVESPILFNLYIEHALNKVKEQVNWGIKIGGEMVRMIRFADDIAVVASSSKELEEVLNLMQDTLSQYYHMNINIKKTKVMKCSKVDSSSRLNIKIGGTRLVEVAEFCYLGSIITKDNRCKRDVRSRIAQAKKLMANKRELLASNINVGVRKRLLKTFVWSVALYGCETWVLGKSERDRLEAFEMWCYRRMMKIKWVDKVR